MAYAFKTRPAKPAFGVFNESIPAGEYTFNRKATTTFCNPLKCPGGPVVASQGDYLMLKYAKVINSAQSGLPFNKTNLNVNLITTLDLSGCCTVQSNPSAPNIPSCSISIPVQNNATEPFFVNYTIDPNGCLFGKNLCGANNYLRRLYYTKMGIIDTDTDIETALNSDKIIFGNEI
jgi:hypothetical protein